MAKHAFVALGSSPYALPMLNFIASSSPTYTELETYFRSVRRLYGISHGLPTSKTISSNLRTLTKFGLARNYDRHWTVTDKGKLILEFEKTFDPEEQTVYLWITGHPDFPLGHNTDSMCNTLSKRHDFQDLSSLEGQHPAGIRALVRLNLGYDETVLVLQEQILCGLTYRLDESRLSKASEDPQLIEKARQYPTMLDFLYVHLTSRLNHAVADVEHAGSGFGTIRWESSIGIANYRTKDLEMYDWQSQTILCPVGQELRSVFQKIAQLRAVDGACRNISSKEGREHALISMSDSLVALERELAELEFTSFEHEQTTIRSFHIIKEKFLGNSVPKKSLDEAIRNVRSYGERKGRLETVTDLLLHLG